MKTIFRSTFLSVLVLLCAAAAKAQDITQIRSAYKSARELESSNESLYNTLLNKPSKSATEVAYEAACKALKAKYASNPYRKLYWIRESEKSFATAVAMNPDNLEIRYLRYAVELNTPAITGCNTHVQEDRQFLIRGIGNRSYQYHEKELIPEIVNFLKLYSNLSTSELQTLREAL